MILSQSPLSDRYHTYDDIVDSLMAWNESFSSNQSPSPYYANSGIIYHMEQIGESNVDELPIYAVKLSYNADQNLDKPRVLILGQCHAEEILGVEVSMGLIERFLYPHNYPADLNTLIGVLYNTEVWIVPTHNPEGHTVVHGWDDDNFGWLQDVSYRKNKTDVNNNGVFDFNPNGYGNDLDGVDLNRNYDFNWIFGDGLHALDGGCSGNPSYISHYDYYRGEAPFSEKEIQAIRDFKIEKKFLLSIAYHSSRSGCVAERVIYPWLWNGGKAAPDYQVISTLGQEMAELIPVEVGDGNYHHAASGSRRGNAHDWTYARTGCIQYLVEVGTENMQPDDIDLINDTVERNVLGAYHLLRRAAGINLGDGPEKFQITGIVTDSNTGQPITAEVKILEMHSPILSPRTTNEFGRYRRLLYADTFSIEFSAIGYETQIIQNIVPSSSSVTELNIALDPLPYYNLSLDLSFPSEEIQDVSMIKFSDSKVDTFNLSSTNNFYWPQGNYDLLFISNDIFPKKQSISLNESQSVNVDLHWYDILLTDDFDTNNNWNIVWGDWHVENGVLKSQENLTYDDYHPLGPSRINLNTPFYIEQDSTVEIAVKLLMKNELEWGRDTLFIDLYNEIDSLNIYSISNQNWNFHDEYIHSVIGDQNNYISMGIKSDITLGYRGLELDKLDILYPMIQGCKQGDFNHDGFIDILDIVGITNYITQEYNLSEFQKCASDINGDIYVDVLDIVNLLIIILEDE